LFDNPLRRVVHKPERILSGLVRPGFTALDLGCGFGHFTIPMARMVGEEGHVIAVDLQAQMLERARRRAVRAGIQSRIRFHQSGREQIGVSEAVDFALAFWMVHEVHDKESFLRELVALLKPHSRFLMVEPRVHVGSASFNLTVETAHRVGMQTLSEVKIAWSRAVLFAPA